MSMINARGTTNGSAYAMWSVMLYGTCKQTDHGYTSCPTSMTSLRSQPLSSASLLKNKPREQHECTNLMHSDLDTTTQRITTKTSNPHESATIMKIAVLGTGMVGTAIATTLVTIGHHIMMGSRTANHDAGQAWRRSVGGKAQCGTFGGRPRATYSGPCRP